MVAWFFFIQSDSWDVWTGGKSESEQPEEQREASLAGLGFTHTSAFPYTLFGEGGGKVSVALDNCVYLKPHEATVHFRGPEWQQEMMI